ncbi:tryptophan-rich sensory protein [Occultella kanbiaonis]|uniref:tryptophan-rich sensory protein n=1 Tax=Occultella kanbiaonis TaxID=2675754 RepID=UPI0012BA301A|nr:tryptophan-rich sensory protein [Occultella kanbiaonis]
MALPHTVGDRWRQVAVTASFLICLIGSMVGVGVFGGTPISSAAGGALSADATLLAPASGAFSVWTVIYLGLAGYTVFQWLPARTADPRQRRLRLPVAGTMLLNAAWILVVQAGWLWLSVLVIAALLTLLAYTFVILVRTRPHGLLERILVDGVLGLYFGWVCVATVANVAAALAANGFDGGGIAPNWWAVAMLTITAGVGVALAIKGGGRLAVAATLAWGLAWIAVARAGGDPYSLPTAVAAGLAALVVLGSTVIRRLATPPRNSDAQMVG